MKPAAFACLILLTAMTAAAARAQAADAETAAGWVKYEGNPVLGGKLGTCFDICVLKDGEQYEPDAIGYATSPDGLTWARHEGNPVIKPDPGIPWEQHKLTGVQIVRQGDWHLMFYIGFRDEHHAQIGVARSRDGITNWQKHPANPIICPGKDRWDADACYKPYAIFDGARWLLWYNGRNGKVEQIGVAMHEGEDLGFEK